MKNESQNDYFDEENDIFKIKQNYLIYKNDMSHGDESYNYINSNLHSVFFERYKKLFREKDIKEIKEKLKLYDKEEKDKVDTKLNEIIKEGELLYNTAFSDYCFYARLFENAKKNYQDWIITKETFNKTCEDAIDPIINTLMKFEKELIIVKDKIKQLNIL